MSKVIKLFFLFVYTLITGYPLVWMIISSMKTNSEFHANPWGFPENLQLSNYVNAWENGIQNYLLNSVWITIITVIATLLAASLIAFILARRPFKGSKIVLSLFLLGMMIPIHSTLISLFVMLNKMHLLNTYGALFFPYVSFSLPVAVFLLYGFYLQLPKELDEAAYMDGCNIYSVFFKIYTPLSKPILATVAIFTALHVWNEFVYALVFISDEAMKTLPIGLLSFNEEYSIDYASLTAALVIATLPTIILYIIMQEHVTKGVAAGAVKG
ncbi:carbohydrate ABC transporter permease [Paenibacillus sp. JSM ZJ436]|uniref:Putative ABC transporter permease protein n=1 Tax=Paenibacillus algicola TaxID=2565926 RepID=A0A4P8XGE2_9BACL|nr:carbohydrate ABC transporter permease [Paenibacillus algicola]QCT01516.1 putative ABC transporter permease protein [Paenibacillus algicola]